MTKYVLVGCGAAKRDERSEARDLYTSTYFAKKREYAETVGDEWAILSAEHGLVEPDGELDPYETHIDDLDDHRLNQLAHRIGMELIEWLGVTEPGDEIVVLAGRSYVDPLRDRETFHAGIDPSVSFPFEQLDLAGIGEQMSWLGDRVAAATAEQSTLITDGGTDEFDATLVDVPTDEDDDGDSDRHVLDPFTSSETDEWSTPPEFVRPLAEAVGGFDLDAAAGAERSPIAEETFTEDDDGLIQPWHGDVWLNPPYSAMDSWTPKVISELQRPAVDSICYLVKGDSSTDWWQDAVEHAEAVAMLDSRLAFGDGDDSAPFASHVFVFGDAPGAVLDVLSRRATVFRAEHIHRETEQEKLVTDGGGPLRCDVHDCDGLAHVRVYPTYGRTDHSALRCRDCYEEDESRDWFERWRSQIWDDIGGEQR